MEPTAQPPASVPPPSPAPAPEQPSARAKALGLAGVIIIVLIGGYFVWAWSAPAWPFEPDFIAPGGSCGGFTQAPQKPCAPGYACQLSAEGAFDEPGICVPEASLKNADWHDYKNEEFGFGLTLTDAWEGYSTETFDDENAPGVNYVNFLVPASDTADGWANPFRIGVYPDAVWADIQSEEGPKPAYLDAKGGYTYAYTTWQDPPESLWNADLDVNDVAWSFYFLDRSTAGWEAYTNDIYGFSLKFPPSWKDYVVHNRPEIGVTNGFQFAYSPTASLPEQAFTILVYSEQEWGWEMELEQPHPQVLARSGGYVFASPFKFEYDNLPGESDIPAILDTFKAAPAAVACPADAMMCPDGSYVGRSGPNCQFVCP